MNKSNRQKKNKVKILGIEKLEPGRAHYKPAYLDTGRDHTHATEEVQTMKAGIELDDLGTDLILPDERADNSWDETTSTTTEPLTLPPPISVPSPPQQPATPLEEVEEEPAKPDPELELVRKQSTWLEERLKAVTIYHQINSKLGAIHDRIINPSPDIEPERYGVARSVLLTADNYVVNDQDPAEIYKLVSFAEIVLLPNPYSMLNLALNFQKKGDELIKLSNYSEGIENYRRAKQIIDEVYKISSTVDKFIKEFGENALNDLKKMFRIAWFDVPEADVISLRKFLLENAIFTAKVFDIEARIRDAKDTATLYKALEELRSLQPPDHPMAQDLLFDVMDEAYRNIVRARLNAILSIIRDAYNQYNEHEYYRAIIILKKAIEQLDSLIVEADKQGYVNEVNYARRVKELVLRNIRMLKEYLEKGIPPRGMKFYMPKADIVAELRTHEEFDAAEVTNLALSRMEEIARKYRFNPKDDLIGDGAFAWVYRATRKKDGLQIALKIFKEMNENTARSLKREIDAVRTLKHEAILTIYDWDPMLGYLEMELADTDLRKVLNEENTLEPKIGVKWVFEIARALDYAHRKNIIHRDVKPSNILIFSKEGKVKLGDWGIAKAMSGARKRKSTTLKLHKAILYSSPEMIERPHEVDRRSDIFQLGLVLYEVLSGVHPFEADNEAAIVHKIMSYEPPPPSAMYRGPHKEEVRVFDEIVMKCIKKNPDHRYQSVKELRVDLARAYKELYQTQLRMSERTDELPYLLANLIIFNLQQYIDYLGESPREHYIESALKYLEELYEVTGEVNLRMTIDELEILARNESVTYDTLNRVRHVLRRWL